MKTCLSLLIASLLAACAEPAPDNAASASSAAPASQPAALEDCITAVGADRSQCRAK